MFRRLGFTLVQPNAKDHHCEILPQVQANGIRGYTNQVRLRGLTSGVLKPAQAGFVCVDAVSTALSSNLRLFCSTSRL